MTHKEEAAVLRADKQTHYNCAQAVLLPFAREAGLTQEQAMALAENFGGGMRHGATCGAVTGALMVLGLRGRKEEDARRFLRAFREREGELTCAKLLALGKERGLEKKPHCDSMVLAAVELAEQILGEDR